MQKKKGISLIVLVITIIVMIILAAAVVISLTNSGIINRADHAVNLTNEQEVQDLAAVAWADAYMEGLRGTELETKVKEELDKQGVTEEDWNITVTDTGVSVGTKAEGAGNWKLQKTVTDGKVTSVTVTNGTQTLDVGTVVNYMPEGVGQTTYTGGWKILGVDEQGRLLIMSSASITGSDITLGGSTLAEATESYKNALTTLEDAVKDYKDGTIGISVRSVTVEDIDALTSFDKTTYKAGQMGVYGNEVTYTWDGTENPAYSYGTPATTGNLIYSHSGGFTYYDTTSGEIVTSAYVEGESGEITTLKDNYYYYSISNYLDSTTPAYAMANDNGDYYWLASRCISTPAGRASFGVRVVYDGSVGYDYLFSSSGDCIVPSHAARAVVTLASGVELTESTTTAGTYDVSLAK